MSVTSKEITSKIIGEIPSGIINGINEDFILANIPINDTVEVILNGLIQTIGISEDYTILGSVVTFIKPPKVGYKILINYET